MYYDLTIDELGLDIFVDHGQKLGASIGFCLEPTLKLFYDQHGIGSLLELLQKRHLFCILQQITEN